MHEVLSEKLFDIVLKETGIDRKDICSKSRIKEIVRARGLFVVLGRKNLMSFPSIGRILHKDHTTMMWSYDSFSEDPWMKEKAELYRDISVYQPSIKPGIGKNIPNKIKIKLSGKYGYLHIMFGEKCFVCGFDEIVEVHHILPKHKGGTDDIENLVLLCPNHHALADRGMLSINNKVFPNYNSDVDLSTHPQE